MFSKFRVEAISDGVFAIVMTLLVIEIKVPQVHYNFSEEALLHGLEELLPLFYSFFLSFALITSYWINHHFIMTTFAKTINRILTYFNFFFLGLISLVPFSANLLGEYPDSRVAIAIYSLHIFLIAIVQFGIREYVTRSPEIENPDLITIKFTPRDRAYGTARILLPVVCSILALSVSYFNTSISIILLLIPVIYGVVPGLLGFTIRILRIEKFLERN